MKLEATGLKKSENMSSGSCFFRARTLCQPVKSSVSRLNNAGDFKMEKLKALEILLLCRENI